MNVLFLTMNPFTGIDMHNIYSDLMQEFIRHGHRPYIVTPREKKSGEQTELTEFEDYGILKVQIGNTSGVSLIEKGISTVTLSGKFYRAVKQSLGHLEFGMMLYSTPPITLAKPVQKLKKLFGCKTYLMLKDIFPQNAVDLGMFSAKSPIYTYFRRQEKKLYRSSDYIGCMSPANVAYVLKQNPEIPPEKVGLCPNAITPKPVADRTALKAELKEKYGIAENAEVFLYGGNLGKPQDIPFVISCLQALKNRTDCHFIICGNGSEYPLLEKLVQTEQPKNVTLISFLPKAEYDRLVMGCDVGLIFLDYRFTIPNFPSRLLSYMEYEMPVLVCTDTVSDMGPIAEANGFGYYSPSNSVEAFTAAVDKMLAADTDAMGKAARAYLEKKYNTAQVYELIMEKIV